MISQLLSAPTGLPEWITQLMGAQALQSPAAIPSGGVPTMDDPLSKLKNALLGAPSQSAGMNFTQPGGLFGTGGASQLAAPTTGGSNLLTILASLGIR